MSRGARWTLGLFALFFAAIFVLSEGTAPSRDPLGMYLAVGFCGLIAVACFSHTWRGPAVRIIGGAVFLITVWVAYLLRTAPLTADCMSENRPNNGPCGPLDGIIWLVFLGLPGLYVAVRGKLPKSVMDSPRTHPALSFLFGRYPRPGTPWQASEAASTVASRPECESPGADVHRSAGGENSRRRAAVHPSNLQAALMVGDFYCREGKFGDAIVAYRDGLAADPANAELRARIDQVRVKQRSTPQSPPAQAMASISPDYGETKRELPVHARIILIGKGIYHVAGARAAILVLLVVVSWLVTHSKWPTDQVPKPSLAIIVNTPQGYQRIEAEGATDLIFLATWCGYSKQLKCFLNDPRIRSYAAKRHLVFIFSSNEWADLKIQIQEGAKAGQIKPGDLPAALAYFNSQEAVSNVEFPSFFKDLPGPYFLAKLPPQVKGFPTIASGGQWIDEDAWLRSTLDVPPTLMSAVLNQGCPI